MRIRTHKDAEIAGTARAVAAAVGGDPQLAKRVLLGAAAVCACLRENRLRRRVTHVRRPHAGEIDSAGELAGDAGVRRDVQKHRRGSVLHPDRLHAHRRVAAGVGGRPATHKSVVVCTRAGDRGARGYQGHSGSAVARVSGRDEGGARNSAALRCRVRRQGRQNGCGRVLEQRLYWRDNVAHSQADN
jgi:hypothetical protein